MIKTNVNVYWTSWISFLLICIHNCKYIAGIDAGIDVEFDIWDGDVTVRWNLTDGKASDSSRYQVQQRVREGSPWDVVAQCNMTRETRCQLANGLDVPEPNIRVGVFDGNHSFIWSKGKRIRLSSTKLKAPEFLVFPGSGAIKVKIVRKYLLEELFPYGTLYSATLYPRGQESQAVTKTVDDEEDEIEFGSIWFWREYCVRVTVEVTSDDLRNTSSQQCLHYRDLWPVLSRFVFPPLVGIVSLLALAFCCFLKSPHKMPTVLNSKVHPWRPLDSTLEPVEVVIESGWKFTSSRHACVEKTDLEHEEKDVRNLTSPRTDPEGPGDPGGPVHPEDPGGSGDPEDPGGPGDPGGSDDPGEDDSGCGSLTGTDDGHSGVDDLLLVGSQETGGGRDLQDALSRSSKRLCEIVVGDGYRSQSPSALPATPCSGHVTCVCSDLQSCVWCEAQKLLESPQMFKVPQLEDLYPSSAGI